MKYLKVFTDFADVIEPLSDAEKGRLFMSMLKYAGTGEPPVLSGNERFVWQAAKQTIDRESLFLEKQRANGSKGGRPQNPNKPNKTQTNPKKPKRQRQRLNNTPCIPLRGGVGSLQGASSCDEKANDRSCCESFTETLGGVFAE